MRQFRIADCGLRIGSTATSIVALAFSLLVSPLSASAGQPPRVPRIGILCSLRCGQPPLELFPEGKAFQEGLAERGYVDGQNIAIDFRAAGGAGELSGLVAKLVSVKVDVILAIGDPAAALAAAKATKTIPIVAVGGMDLVQLGLVTSLARPGGNITGVTVPFAELVAKQMELLKEAVAGISRIAVLRNPGNTLHRHAVTELDAAAKSLGVQVQLLEARSPSDFESAIAGATKGRAGALLVLWDPLYGFTQGRLTMLALQQRLPSISEDRQFVKAAGFISFGPNVAEMYRRAAYYVDRILRGARPADLPAEQPTQFHLAINLTTANALGLKIPQSVLVRADEVIQ